ncbi:MAG: hypothetical protein EBQ92_05785 [Proteobacteria bacterium]|nr:hypothetical protein [Pseudomonadota bacterium]
MKIILSILLLLGLSTPSLAARKDFKGLFGSYQRDKFTENEAHDSDWGVDLSLSSLIPVTSVVNSTSTPGAAGDAMRFSTFFNVEGSLLFSLAYNWQLYASVGYFSYDTRKEINNGSLNQALFHQFDFKAIPVLLGTRYRFGSGDLVPYLGLGVGFSRVERKGSYDIGGAPTNEQIDNVITGQVQGGLEFYFSPRAGLRLEIAAHYFKTPEFRFDAGTPVNTFPHMIYQPNIFSVRYASGLFFLF